jgi:hypothetical protein
MAAKGALALDVDDKTTEERLFVTAFGERMLPNIFRVNVLNLPVPGDPGAALLGDVGVEVG